MSNNSCFFITPIGAKDSPIRRKSEGLLNSVIDPLLKELSITSTVSYKISESGTITNQIIEHLLKDDLVIANLTELNENVMYELAVRHACAKPLVILAENGTGLPFDIATQRVLSYSNDMEGVKELKKELKDAIEATLKKMYSSR